jgi:hypothetical protein
MLIGRYILAALVAGKNLLDPHRQDLAGRPIIEVERRGETIFDTISPLNFAGGCNKRGP